MDEQAVCPLSYSETMTVGPSAPPIMPIADAAFRGARESRAIAPEVTV